MYFRSNGIRPGFITATGIQLGQPEGCNGGERDKKFVGKMVRLILEGQKSLKVVNDKWGSPTYARDLLAGIERLIQRRAYGLYHMANEGRCSRYEIALQIREILRCPDVELEPVSSDQFPLPAPRGRSEAIENRQLKLLGFPPMRPWQEAVREYLEKELSGERAGA